MSIQEYSEVTSLNATETNSELSNHQYYIILKDKDGTQFSYNYCGCWSNTPYSGFSLEIPDHFRDIIERILSNSANELRDYNEYTITSKTNEGNWNFVITETKQVFDGRALYQILIRPTKAIDQIIEECKRELVNERKLNRMNCKCISSVSHDFRTPLSIIYANLQLLEYHEFQLDQETIEDAFSLSRMAVKSLLRVLDKVTVVDSINKGRLEYKPSRVSVKTLCESMVKELNEAEVLPDRVKYIHDNSIDEVELDAYLFNSLFMHLIFNALSYSKKNHNVLFESMAVSPNELRFTVTDKGIGLTAEQLQALTVYFSSIDKLDEGIGLGLAIVRECLFLMKGTLTINSETGKGSTFIIDLPINISVEEREIHGYTD